MTTRFAVQSSSVSCALGHGKQTDKVCVVEQQQWALHFWDRLASTDVKRKTEMASMNASMAMGILAFIVLGLPTSAHANNLEFVRRKLTLLGYDQIEFVRNKPPFEVNVCRGTKRFRLHVDSYRKITEKTRTGFCSTAVETEAEPKDNLKPNTRTINTVECKRFFPAIGKTLTVDCGEPDAEPKDEPKARRNIDCKRFFPSIGKTLTVTCE
ncbi:MAG: hypothetical protein ACR2OF_00085 [Hyphomicrobium sp.]